MPSTVTVYPTKKTAVGLEHPHGPVLVVAGSQWPQDSFTARRLTDGSVTKDATKVYVPPAAPAPSPAATAPTASAPSEQASTTTSAPAAEPTAAPKTA